MCEALMKTQQRALLSQRGILKRFDIRCYGKQETLADIQRYKSAMHRKLKGKGGLAYDRLFLRYEPKGQVTEPTPISTHVNGATKTRTIAATTRRKHNPKNKKTRKKKNNLFLGIF